MAIFTPTGSPRRRGRSIAWCQSLLIKTKNQSNPVKFNSKIWNLGQLWFSVDIKCFLSFSFSSSLHLLSPHLLSTASHWLASTTQWWTWWRGSCRKGWITGSGTFLGRKIHFLALRVTATAVKESASQKGWNFWATSLDLFKLRWAS